MDRASLSVTRSGDAQARIAPVILSPSLQCTCALLCGYLAAGLDLVDSVALLRLVAVWLLADATCGYVFAQLVALKATARLSAAELDEQSVASSNPRSSSLRMALPNTAEGAPSARLAARLRDRIARCGVRLGTHALDHGLAALVTSGLVLVVATYLGREVLAVVGFGLVLASLVMAMSGRNLRLVRRWFGGLHVALAWQLGYVVLASWSSLALGVAVLMGLGTWARIRLVQDECSVARYFSETVQGIWVVLFLLKGQPVLASVLAILALGERVVQPAGRGRLAWFLSMVVVALGVRYWY